MLSEISHTTSSFGDKPKARQEQQKQKPKKSFLRVKLTGVSDASVSERFRFLRAQLASLPVLSLPVCARAAARRFRQSSAAAAMFRFSHAEQKEKSVTNLRFLNIAAEKMVIFKPKTTLAQHKNLQRFTPARNSESGAGEDLGGGRLTTLGLPTPGFAQPMGLPNPWVCPPLGGRPFPPNPGYTQEGWTPTAKFGVCPKGSGHPPTCSDFEPKPQTRPCAVTNVPGSRDVRMKLLAREEKSNFPVYA